VLVSQLKKEKVRRTILRQVLVSQLKKEKARKSILE